MLHKSACRIAKYFEKNGIINQDDTALCSYGLETLMATAIGILLSMALGAVLHEAFAVMLFLIAFIPLRSYAGGIHLYSHFLCISSLLINVALVIYICKMVSPDVIIPVLSIMLLPAFICVYYLSPIENKRKPLSDTEKKDNKQVSIYIVILESYISLVVLYRVLSNGILCLAMLLGMYSAILSMVLSDIFSQINCRRKQ